MKERIHRKLFNYLACIIIILAIICLSARQEDQKKPQEEKPVASGLTEKVEVNLVLLEATVHDKKGNHIRGLSKEDFQIFEEGKKQKIAVFEEIDLVRTEPYEEAVEKKLSEEKIREEVNGMKKPDEESKKRTFLFLFDVYNQPSALFLSKARKAVGEFMEQKFKPGDVAAIFEMTPELSMVSAFTSDPQEIIRSLDKIRFFPGKNVGDDMISQATEMVIPYKDDFARRVTYAAALRNQIFRQERQQYYYNLGSLAFTLSELPGKRMILLFSGGFPMTMPGDINDQFGGITPAFRDLISNMAKHRVSIYTFDIAEFSKIGDASERIDYRIALDKLGFGESFFEDVGIGSSFWTDSAEMRRQILAVLGNETGGGFMVNPDYRVGLSIIDDDTNHYYLLGYYPTEKVEKERYRRIKIEIARDDARITSRKGRFAVKEDVRKKAAPESALQDVKKLQHEMEEPNEAIIPCDVSTIFSPLPDGKTRVTFALQTYDAIKPFVNDEGIGIVDMTLKIYANAGQITVDSKEKDIKTVLKPEGVQALGAGFRIMEYLDVVPAVYDYQIFLRLNGLSKYAVWSKALEVPKFKKSDFKLGTFSIAMTESSPLIFDSYSESGTGGARSDTGSLGSPFELKNGMKISPVATRSFREGESIFLFYKVMNAKRDEGSGKPDIGMTFKLIPLDTDKKAEESSIQASVIYFAPEREGNSLDTIVELKIIDHKPGFYLLKAYVTDKRAGSMSSQEERLQLL